MRKMTFQFSKQWQDDIFFNMKYHVYGLLKNSCFEIFGDRKCGLFSSQQVDGKMIFTEHWKVLDFKFLEMGNTVFFRAKNVMERWYLQITEKFLFWAFRWWEIWSFFQRKKWWKDDIYLVFLSFPWYSRTWKIWIFMQC